MGVFLEDVVEGIWRGGAAGVKPQQKGTGALSPSDAGSEGGCEPGGGAPAPSPGFRH